MGLMRQRVHVLVAALDGGAYVRLVVHEAVRRLGWVRAWSPADADVLVVCGQSSGWSDEVVDRLWLQLPGPRVRVDLASPDGVRSRLVEAAAGLEDVAMQDRNSAEADASAPRPDDQGNEDQGMPDEQMEEHGAGTDDHGMDMPGHDLSGHDMHMGGEMDKSGPFGIPLAMSSNDDRDGLEMDAAHLVLGPGLPSWPAGLVVRAELHGDVVTNFRIIHEPTTSGWGADALEQPAMLLDAAASVLELTGWSLMAERVHASCGSILDGRSPAEQADRVERISRRVRRAVLLRWSLTGLRGDDASAGAWVLRRLLLLLDEATAVLRDPEHPVVLPGALGELGHLVTGQDVETLRLVVAALGVDARVVTHA